MNLYMILAETEPTSLGVIAGLIAVVMAVVKIVEHSVQYMIGELKRRREAGEARRPGNKKKLDQSADALLARIEVLVDDLHKWHAPEDPQQPGIKVWWNSEEQRQQLRDLVVKLNQMAAELIGMRNTHTSCNESQVCYIEKQRDEVEELRRRVDELQEQRLADRDALYERLIRVQNIFATRIERGVDSGSGSGHVVVEADPAVESYESDPDFEDVDGDL